MLITRVAIALIVTALALLPGVLSDHPAAASHTTIATVALEGDPITVPSAPFRTGGTYALAAFGDPHVNENGDVAFTATTIAGPPPEPCAVLLGSPGGTPSIIAADGDEGPPPYSGQALNVCDPPFVLPSGDPLVNNNGDVAYKARLMGIGKWALWVRPFGAPFPIPVVVEGDPVPGGGGFYGPPELLDMNDSAQLLFTADNSGTPTLWRSDAGVVSKVVAVGETLPGGGGTVTALGGGGGGGTMATINAGGVAAWRVTTTSGGGIYTGATPSPTKVVANADTWFTGPPVGDVDFTVVSEPDVQDDGIIAFRATADPPYGEGYFEAGPDGVGGYMYTKRVLEADPNPEAGGTWGSLDAQGAHFSAGGQAMVSADDGTASEVMYLYPSYHRVVGVGDTSPEGSGYSSIDSATVNEENIAIGAVVAGGVGCAVSPCGGIFAGGSKTDPNKTQAVYPDFDNDGIDTARESSAVCGWDVDGGGIDLNFDLDGDTVCDIDPVVPDVFVEVDYLDCAVTSGALDNSDPKDLDGDTIVNEPDGIPDDDLPSDCAEDGVTTCSDGIDQPGGDALIDAADPDCINHSTGLYDASLNLEDGVQACNDGVDNGPDGSADGADSDCHNHEPLGGIIEGGAAGPLGVYSCEDGSDNDGDTLTDLDDPDCSVVASFADSPVHNAYANEDGIATCGDGVDNGGGDGADTNDADCHTDGNAGNPGSYDASRIEDKVVGTCNDGLDNGGDGGADAGVDLNADYDYLDANEFPPDDDCTGVNLHVVVDEPLAHSLNLDFKGAGATPCTVGMGSLAGHASFDLVKPAHFGSVGDTAAALAAKRLVFHYALSTHQQDPSTTSSGCGEQPGNDFYVSLGGWTNVTAKEHEAAFMHELGHNLNLCHGGPANLALPKSQCDWNYKPNYLSVMNYSFSFPWTPDGKATGRPLDYSRVALPPGDPALAGCPVGGPAPNVLNENGQLAEGFGIDCTIAAAVPASWPNTAYTYISGLKCPFQVTSATGGIDWDHDGVPGENNQTAPINDPVLGVPWPPDCTNNPVLTNLQGFDDWANLVYNFRGAGGFGDGLPSSPVPPDEPSSVPPPDSDTDGYHDGQDNCPGVVNPGQENAVHPLTSEGDHCEDPDSDGKADISDECPDVFSPWIVPAGDGDCDGFTATEEAFTGTDSGDNCPDNVDDDAWPADMVHTSLGFGKHDGSVNILDIVQLTPPVFNTSPPNPNYLVRKDLNGDGTINILDIVRLTPPTFNTTCT